MARRAPIKVAVPPGRPAADATAPPLQRVQLRLDAASHQTFRTLGAGNVSEGAREAARLALLFKKSA